MNDPNQNNPPQEQAPKPSRSIYDDGHAKKDYLPYSDETIGLDPLLKKSIREAAEAKLITWTVKAHKIHNATTLNDRAMPYQEFHLEPPVVEGRTEPILTVDDFRPVLDQLIIKECDAILKIACSIACREMRQSETFQGRVFKEYKAKIFRTGGYSRSVEGGHSQ